MVREENSGLEEEFWPTMIAGLFDAILGISYFILPQLGPVLAVLFILSGICKLIAARKEKPRETPT